MSEFVFINCPNCKAKLKIDREKKYHDCEECKFEFRIDQAELPERGQGGTPQKSLLEKLQKLRGSE
jgi:Zn finger protein HypA/HybF involved in hydrogenase expression